MKKIIILLAALTLPLLAGAQAQIITKKVKIADFPEKITKMVLNGNQFYDTVLKDEVAARWRISPYEFCTLEEFETLKGSDQYYFLMMTSGQFRKETAPGLQFITLVKGGAGSEKGINEMLEVVSLPFASVEYPSGREFTFLPAFLDIIQDHIIGAIEKDFNAYGGLGNYTTNISKNGEKTIVFSEEDLSKAIDENFIKEHFDEEMKIVDTDDADQYMIDYEEGTIVSYVVAPSEPVVGSYCYKMLFDAETHMLYFYRKHRITKQFGVGFLPKDIKDITLYRK